MSNIMDFFISQNSAVANISGKVVDLTANGGSRVDHFYSGLFFPVVDHADNYSIGWGDLAAILPNDPTATLVAYFPSGASIHYKNADAEPDIISLAKANIALLGIRLPRSGAILGPSLTSSISQDIFNATIVSQKKNLARYSANQDLAVVTGGSEMINNSPESAYALYDQYSVTNGTTDSEVSRIDLGSTKSLGNLGLIWGLHNCSVAATFTVKLEYSTNGTDWTTAFTDAYTMTATKTIVRWESLVSNISARYVRILVSSDSTNTVTLYVNQLFAWEE